jgi:hypothetical protein
MTLSDIFESCEKWNFSFLIDLPAASIMLIIVRYRLTLICEKFLTKKLDSDL